MSPLGLCTGALTEGEGARILPSLEMQQEAPQPEPQRPALTEEEQQFFRSSLRRARYGH